PEVLVATVVNFPAGDDAVDHVLAETEAALAAGADEIDVVLPYRAFLEDRFDEAAAMIDAVRAVVDENHAMKVIIESGAMTERAHVDAASRFAVEHGADFVKTSTGKIDVSATPEAAETILGVLSTADRPSASRSPAVCAPRRRCRIPRLADRIMGDGWTSPPTASAPAPLAPARPSPPTSRPPRPSQRRPAGKRQRRAGQRGKRSGRRRPPAREAPATSRRPRGVRHSRRREA
ncbi:MAG: hypothetical protein WKF45_09975, partial [Ilumatobacteraceae bacterium]